MVDIVKAAEDIVLTKIIEHANKIYEYGEKHEAMKEAEFIVIPKIEVSIPTFNNLARLSTTSQYRSPSSNKFIFV